MSSNSKNTALLLARLIIGGIFIYSGWAKVSDIAMTIGYFSAMGIPAFMAYVVGYLELIGGVLVVVGFWTEISAAILAVIMTFAVYFSFSGGFLSYGLPLVTFAGLILLATSGAGKFSIH